MWPFNRVKAGGLPLEVQATIAGATFITRSNTGSEDGRPRTIANLPGCGSFELGRDDQSIEAALRRRFALSETQLRRAMTMLDARRREHQRREIEVEATIHGGSRRGTWRDAWRPLPRLLGGGEQ